MKRFMTIVFALSMLVVASGAFAQDNQYGWTVSNSNTDAFANTGAPTGGLATLYLWYQCNDNDGISAAEMAFSTPPISALTPMNGFLNASPDQSFVQLVVGGCPNGPVVAGSLLYIDAVGIEVCLIDSPNGFNLSVDCLNNFGWNNGYTGYSSVSASPPCTSGELCPPVSVDDQTWGGVKSLYR